MNIEKVRIAKPYNDLDIESNVLSVLRSGRLVQGAFVKSFENAIENYLGTRHAIAVSSGTAAIHAALSAVREKATKATSATPEVITTPLSFSATANAIVHAGCKPVFVDVNEATFNIDEDRIEKAVDESTIAIEPVDVFGLSANLSSIRAIAQNHSLTVVEDAAEAIGASHEGMKVGCISSLTCFSTYATKNIHSGEGGFVTTNDDTYDSFIRVFRNQGQVSKYNQKILGYNYRMQEISAAIATGQVSKIDEFRTRRAEHAARLMDGLSDIESLSFQQVKNPSEHAWYMFAAILDQNRASLTRDKLVERLNEEGVEADVAWPLPIHLQPYYRKRYGFKEGGFPNAERICKSIFQLPIQSNLTTQQVDEVISKVRALAR